MKIRLKKILLFVILDKFSDWEYAYLSPLILALANDTYSPKTVSLTREPVYSLAGFTVIPDYDIDSVPEAFDGVILIGGMSWRDDSARGMESLVNKAFKERKLLAGICDAAGFLGTMGVLNDVFHTFNYLADLKKWAGTAYRSDEKHKTQQAVRDNNIITANGTADLEFAKEVLIALKAASENVIIEWYNFYKLGAYNAPMPIL